MRMIIDTDAGVDDAHAIMMALAYPVVQIEAITTVTGNIHVEQVNQNVFTTLDIMGMDIPVYQGADRPLVADWRWETEAIHGSDGLGDWADRPATQRQLESEHAAHTIIRLVNQHPGEITVVALGPLTNLALATRLDPDLPTKVKRLIFMGGTIAARGNTNMLTAEFNIYCDPEAAHIVLDAFTEAQMVSWETTLGHPLPWEHYETLIGLPTRQAQFFKNTSASTIAFLRTKVPDPTYLLPDPLAMAIALEPELISESERHHVAVELQGTLTRGQTVIDYSRQTGKLSNVEVVTQIDLDGVYRLYRQMLSGEHG